MVDNWLVVMQFLLAAIGVYQFTLSLFGIYRKKKHIQHEPKKTFAVLVAAHNEATVIDALMENLKTLDYPKDMYDVFVICDNCTDNTAEIVRAHGWTACERHNPQQRGKGFAIEWMLKNLWEMERQFDAVVMIDADNLVSTDFLTEMNNDLCSGARVIQGYIDTKNPHDSWITAAYGVTYWYCNRLWQLSRTNLKMANFLGGTGMCFESKLLQEMGWGATSLVEDLEFTVRCVKNGVNPVFNYKARVFDEKPLTFKASARQRLRWMQGHFTVARRYFFPLMWQSIKERNLAKFDTALYSMTVYTVLITFLLTAYIWVDAAFFNGPNFPTLTEILPPWLFVGSIVMTCAAFILALVLEGVRSPRIYASLLTFPIFLLSWWPITFYAFFTQNNKVWSHTEHTRVVRLEDVQGKQA
ncbi:glycosyltransferase family 2 protein [Paenibacillus arenosi]|uniref:Glycosyltransferase family 2 protein n=1 Tax=Paenibacillus arenosi TaxID=2774142 RepID=A0ABR9B044_9BACL|nr:glycosyltransferase family 2 protein [Paenibacillus arenosi]MBD8498830.1 glycosyltransferase family 2 protein [Paenibacillus arenosi]